jgi:hypothetical protein
MFNIDHFGGVCNYLEAWETNQASSKYKEEYIVI